MRPHRLAALVILAASLTGCQAMLYGTATDFEKVAVGMSKDQVVQAIGEPVSVGADGAKGESYLVYKRMSHAVSAWPRNYVVTLKDGSVTRFGEQEAGIAVRQ